MSFLTLDNIGFHYDEPWVLKDITCGIAQGEFVGILGPNGSGKTTLLKILDGILKPQEGRVSINGVPLASIRRNDLAKIIAVVAQDVRTTFPFSVQEVVLMGRSPHLRKWRFEGETDVRIARNAMAMTDTLSLAARPMEELSGGERQRVLIARALAQEPQVLLLDEPTAFLDIKHQMDFFDLVKALNRKNHLTIVAVTHDVNLASLYCDRLILMRGGRILVQGRPQDVITEESIAKVYQVRATVDINPITGRPRISPIGGQAKEEDSLSASPEFFVGQDKKLC